MVCTMFSQASQALLGRKAARPAARTVCRAEPGQSLAKVRTL